MLDFLGTAEENHMVEMIPGLGKIPFWGDFSKFDRWSFYVDYYNMIDRYVFQTCACSRAPSSGYQFDIRPKPKTKIYREEDGILTMNEIEDVYRDILAEYPNCGGFERDVGKFMAEIKRILFILSTRDTFWLK